MNKPNYKNGSVINLMSSIKQSLGGKHQYRPLKRFPLEQLNDKNILLIVADGLGYAFLIKSHSKTFSNKTCSL